MLQVQDAVKRAKAYLPGLLFDTSAQIADVRLEEVELSEDEKFWNVTFPYLPVNTTVPLVIRQYKTIRIKAASGEFVGLRNGMLASV
jgi:hypothetical protein